MSAVRSRDGDSQRVDVGIELGLRAERAARGTAQRRRDLCAHVRCGERDRKRAARTPEADSLHGVPGFCSLSNAASAAGDMSASASRTEGHTSRTWLNRLIAKISPTTGCSRATAMRLWQARACLAAIMSTRSPTLL